MSDVEDRLAVLEARLEQLDAAEPRAAPLGFFQVAPGESILSDHMNTAVLQGIPPFASAAARDAAIPSPTNGTHCHLLDLKQTQARVAGVWQPVAGNVPNAWLQWVGSQLITSGDQKLDGFTPAGPSIGGGALNTGLAVRFPTSGSALFLGVIDCQAASTTDFTIAVGTTAAMLLGGSGASNVASTKRARLTLSTVLNVTAGTNYCLWSTASANYDVKEVMLTARFLGPT